MTKSTNYYQNESGPKFLDKTDSSYGKEEDFEDLDEDVPSSWFAELPEAKTKK